jgi:hypothetical protein
MQRKSHELLVALIAIVFITISYLLIRDVLRETPMANSFYGHSMGILGFLLMLMTETLYTLRKRSHNARWGQMAAWLDFHIFTGLVGPYMVLLHSAWQFNGLAGIVSLLTLVIVLSGFIGRYIYTAIPRTPAGVELSLDEMRAQVKWLEAELTAWTVAQPGETPSLAPTQAESAPASISNRGWWESLTGALNIGGTRHLDEGSRATSRRLASVRRERNRLRSQIQSLSITRRMLAIWHIVHIPLGFTLFGMAFIHIIAAVYFAVLLTR